MQGHERSAGTERSTAGADEVRRSIEQSSYTAGQRQALMKMLEAYDEVIRQADRHRAGSVPEVLPNGPTEAA